MGGWKKCSKASVTMSQLIITMLVMMLVTVNSKDTRDDGKCGAANLAPSGKPAKCEHIPPFPTCCQNNGHCGWDCDDVPQAPAPAPVPSAPSRPLLHDNDPVRTPAVSSSGGFRDDGRCGSEFPLDDGTPASCDPNSEYFCCSAHGYCGGTGEHCSCDTCVNYRPAGFSGGSSSSVSLNGRVRSDRRCGPEFPLDDGEPSECDGASGNHCCSNWGYCGPGADHCECPAVWITEQLSKGSVTGWVCGGGIEDVVQNSHFPTIQVQHSATLTVKTFVAVNGDTVEVMESTAAVLLALIIEIIENKKLILSFLNNNENKVK